MTNVLTAIFVISASTMLMRRIWALLSVISCRTVPTSSPAQSDDSPTRTKSGSRMSLITLPRAMNSGL